MPSVEDLLLKEVVDKLGYMGWQMDQGPNPVEVSSCPEVHVEGCVCVSYTCTMAGTLKIGSQERSF